MSRRARRSSSARQRQQVAAFEQTSPAVGSSSLRMHRPMVVFPLPDSPTRPNVSPAQPRKSPSRRPAREPAALATPGSVESFTRLRTVRSASSCGRRPTESSATRASGPSAGERQAGSLRAFGPRHRTAGANGSREASPPARAPSPRSVQGGRGRRMRDRARAGPRVGRAGERKTSRRGPCSTIRPAYITATRSALPGDDAEVVGDQQHRQVELAAHLARAGRGSAPGP